MIQERDPRLKDFRNFLYYIWTHPEGPLALHGCPEPTPCQYQIADMMQRAVKHVVFGGQPDPFMWDEEKDRWYKGLVVLAFRGVGKSWIAAALNTWALYWNPGLSNMIVSAAKERSDSFSTFCKRLLRDVDVLQPLQPRKDQRSSNLQFDVDGAPASQAPSVRSIGVMGMMTGGRADIIIPDDIEVPNNSETEAMRDKLSFRSKEFAAILKPPLEPDKVSLGGVVVYLGTPQNENSIYNKLPDRGYRKVIVPARYPGEKWMVANGIYLADFLKERMDKDPSLLTGGGLVGTSGKPTDTRFSEADLQAREIEYGSHDFALQFMLDTSLADAERYPLKLRNLVCMDLDKELAPTRIAWGPTRDNRINEVASPGLQGDHFHGPMNVGQDFTPYTGSVMAIDPSGTGKDELAYCITNHLNGVLFVMQCRGMAHGYAEENLVKLAEAAKTFGVKHIIIESNFGDGMFKALLDPVLAKIYPCRTEDVRHSTQKERRIIDTLEPLLANHRVIVSTQVLREDYRVDIDCAQEKRTRYQLFYQMSRITLERNSLVHDDRLDALAMSAAYWVNAVSQDVETAAQRHEEELLEAQWRDFEKRHGKFKGSNKSPVWML